MPSCARPVHLFAAVLAAFAFAPCKPIAAQCLPEWLPGEPKPVPGGIVNASTTWDPDGAGPAPSVLVVGGLLTAGTSSQVAVATYDGTTWSPLGALAGTVRALAVHNGQLHASVTSVTPFGSFASVQVWDGSTWQAIGNLGSGFVNAMTTFNGQLVVAGSFFSITGTVANNIASWNGTSWSAFGTGVQGTVRALAVFNSVLHVGGSIFNAGGLTVGNLAIWNGSTWVATPSFNNTVEALAVRSGITLGTATLFVGGAFTSFTVGTQVVAASHVASFTALTNSWAAVGSGLPGARCTSLLARSTGTTSFVLLAGIEDAASQQRVWQFSSGAWSALGSLGDGSTNIWPATIAFFGGSNTVGLNSSSTAVRAFDGSQWQGVVGQGVPNIVFAVEPVGNEVVIGGSFTTIHGVAVNGVARGSSGSWTPLGTGVTGGQGVFALTTAANGDIIAAGDFTTAGGFSANRIARWNGTAWAPLGTGLNGPALALLALPNGDIVAAGDFTTAGGVSASRIARWNGITWAPLGLGFPARVNALARLDNGDIVAGGNFLTTGALAVNRIAQWNGSTWLALGGGCNNIVFALATAPTGELYVGGRFTAAGGLNARLASWKNGVWTPINLLGLNAVDIAALAVHPNGTLLIGGATFSFSLGPFGGFSTNLLMVRNGTQSSLDVKGSLVYDIAASSDIVIGGIFDSAGGVIAGNVARFHAPCPATSTPYGVGCSGLTGPLTLQALEAPWLGGSYRLRAANYGPTGFGLQILGLPQVSLPLSVVFAEALPGCRISTIATFLDVVLPVGGAVTFGGSVPLDSSLIGFEFQAQAWQFETGASGLAVSSSNGVQLVIGTF
ncbi:MAG TPA: hypothetical protein VFZ65_15480 [Planctomycetota bacterium]|nr:hypothetical protein [Planctomycetota bacterium]